MKTYKNIQRYAHTKWLKVYKCPVSFSSSVVLLFTLNVKNFWKLTNFFILASPSAVRKLPQVMCTVDANENYVLPIQQAIFTGV